MKISSILLIGLVLVSAIAQETNETNVTIPESVVTPPAETTDTFGTSPPTTPDTTGEGEVLPTSETVSTEATATSEEVIPADLLTLENTTAETPVETPAEGAQVVVETPVEPQPVEITSTTTAQEVISEVQGEVQNVDAMVETQVAQPELLSCEVARHTFAIEEAVIRMKGVLDYVSTELGVDATQLGTIKDDLYATIVDAQAATDATAFQEIMDKSRSLISEFRETANGIEGFDKTKAQTYIDKAMTDNKEYLAGIAAERNKACEAVVLKRFDLMIENLGRIIKELEESGDVDAQVIANLKYRLELLIKMRADLQAALDSGDETKVKAIEQAFRDITNELKLKAGAVRIFAKETYGHVVGRLRLYRNIVRVTEKKLDKLAQTGVDVTDAKQKLADINAKLDKVEEELRKAKSAWQSKDYSAAKAALEKANSLLDEIKDSFNQDVRGKAVVAIKNKLCGDMQQVIGNAETELQNAKAAIDELSANETADPARLKYLTAFVERMQERLDEVKEKQSEGNVTGACVGLSELRAIYAKVKAEVANRRKLAQGQEIMAVSEVAAAASTTANVAQKLKVLKAVTDNPELVENLCKQNKDKCKEFLKNNPQVARIVGEKAPQIIQEAVSTGATSEDDLANIYQIRNRTKIQEMLNESLKNKEEGERKVRALVETAKAQGEKISEIKGMQKIDKAVETRIERLQKVDELLKKLEQRKIRITLKCRAAVTKAIGEGVTDVEKLAAICNAPLPENQQVGAVAGPEIPEGAG